MRRSASLEPYARKTTKIGDRRHRVELRVAQTPTDVVTPSADLYGERKRETGVLPHSGFIGAGAVLLMSALGTDSIYYLTALSQWANFSAWLITGGLLAMLVAAIFLLIDFATGRVRRLVARTFVFVTAAALLSLVNAFVHSRDTWSSVVPQGILLSAVSTLLLLIAGARGWNLATKPATGDRL